ncbi:MAG TPA: hypothetical protein VIA02_01325 [Candidatus Limnocylindria bacterium]|jgi:hypothetical protein
MFNIEHPDDYLDRVDADRGRIEERNRLMRALRGSTPPFDAATERELRDVMRRQLQAQSEPGR